VIKPRWRKVFRDAWHHKGRTALVILAIAIGITGAGSVLNTWSLLRVVTHDGYLATNPASATLRLDSIDDALLAKIRALPSIADVQARRTVIASVMVDGSWRSAMIFSTRDFMASNIGRLTTQSGSWPPADGSIVIESSSVDFAGAIVGEPMTFQLGQGSSVALPVQGIVRDAGLAPGWMEHVVYAFATPATLALIGAPSSLDQLQILVRDRSLDREGVRLVANEVRDVAISSGHRVTGVEVPEPGRHIHAAQIDSLLMTQGMFGVLALLLSGFLVVNLITAMLAGQVREIGVMKTLGGSPSQLASMYLGLALVLGLVACAIAIPVALLIGRWYAGFTSTLLNFDTAGFDVPRWSIGIQLAAGVVLPLAAAAIPVIRGSRMPVSEALRDFGITSSDDDGLMRRIDGFGRPVLLALRNSLRKRQRTALTLATLALGGAVYVGALNLRSSISASVGYLYGEINRFDMTVRFAEPHAADSITSLVASMPGVERAEAWLTRRAAVALSGGDLGPGFPLVGLSSDSRMVAYPLTSGRWLEPGDKNALVVGRRVAAEDPTIVVGREIPLVIDGKQMKWKVVGIAESGPAPVALTLVESLSDKAGSNRVDLAVVRTVARDGVSQGALGRRLRQDLDDRGFTVSSVSLTEENRRVLEDHLLMVAGFLLIMSQAMIVVGGLGLASTMSLAVLERTREIGVMRAIGARHSSILGMLQMEALAMSIAGWALAIPLSLPASIIIGKVFGRIMFPVPVSFIPDVRAVVNWLAVVIVVSIVACAWPAFRATRITTAKALSYE